jgi:hypothetical protein
MRARGREGERARGTEVGREGERGRDEERQMMRWRDAKQQGGREGERERV